jgi:glycosyltransferase involved in cell wall biosynthesis
MVEPGGQNGPWDYTCALARQLAALRPTAVLTSADHEPLSWSPEFRILAGTIWRRSVRRGRRNLPEAVARRLGNSGRYIRGLMAALLELRREQYPVVHCHGLFWTPLVLVTALAARASGRKFVYTPHNTFSRSGRALERWAWWAGQRLIMRFANAIVVHTEFDRAELTARIGGVAQRLHVIPHGPSGAGEPVPTRDDARMQLGLDSGCAYVGLLGHLSTAKGIPELLQAFSTVVERLPSVRLLMAGEDREGVAAAALGVLNPEVRSRIEFRPRYIAPELLASHFAAVDLVCLPYQVASASGVGQRALTYGRPIVAFDVGGLRQSLGESGSVTWVPAGDCAALGEAIVTQLQRADARIGVATSAEPVRSWHSAALLLSKVCDRATMTTLR